MENIVKAKVYIDGANMFYTQKRLGWTIDWGKMKKFLEKDKEIIEWRYYVGLKHKDEKMNKYLSYLNHAGFSVSTKPLKKIKLKNSGIIKGGRKINHIYKCNFDVEMTADILLDKLCPEEIIIFSGDSDFTYLVKKLKDIGRRTIVFASRRTLSWELKLEVSDLIYLENIRQNIEREQ